MVSNEAYIDWCGKDGCSSRLDKQITLTQRVSLSKKRQEILSDFCADFRLNENKQIEYNQISCQDKRKPLCMAGKPADGSANSINVVQTSKRFKKKRKMKKHKKIKLREGFIMKNLKMENCIKNQSTHQH